MKFTNKYFVRISIVSSVILLSAGCWWYFVDSRTPQARPDLVRLPDTLPAPPKGYPSVNALMLNYALGWIDTVDIHSPSPLPTGIAEERDQEYGRVGDRALLLDLYKPEDISKPAAGILFIHGGGWSSGDKSDYRLYATHFAQLGYVVGCVGYRLKKEATYPAAIEDVKCAVRWMRSHAESLHVDPDRIAIIGGSAGGHLSMMVGYSSDVSELEGTGGWPDTSSAVQAVVDLYGPTDFTTPYARTHETTTSYLVSSYGEAPELYEQCSPLFHLDANDPPTLIFHGTLDDLVPVTQSDKLAEKLESLGVPYWYDRIDGWPHSMDIAKSVGDHVKIVVGAFLDQHLRENQVQNGEGSNRVRPREHDLIANLKPDGNSQAPPDRKNDNAKSTFVKTTLELADGGRMNCHLRQGTEPTLVLIPGTWGGFWRFESLIAALPPEIGIAVVELAWQAGNKPPSLELSMVQIADDVLQAIEAMELRRFVVAGHSIGGMIAVEIAGRNVHGLVGAIPMEGWTHHTVVQTAFDGTVVSNLTAEEEAHRQADRQRGRHHLSEKELQAIATIWRQWDGSSCLERSTIPILEIWGDRGKTRPNRKALRLPERDNIELSWISDASHLILLEDPELVARVVLEFLKKLNG